MIHLYVKSDSIKDIIELVNITDYLKSEDFSEFRSLLRLDNQNLVLIFQKSSDIDSLEREINSFSHELLIISCEDKNPKKFKLQKLESPKSNSANFPQTMNVMYHLHNSSLGDINLPEGFKTEKEYLHYITTILIKKVYPRSIEIGYLDLIQMLSSDTFLLKTNQKCLIQNTDLKSYLNFLVKIK